MLTNKLGLPQPFVDAVSSKHVYRERRYSVTDLLGGTCEAVLKRRHASEGDYDASDMIWAIFGSAVHKVLEDAKAADHQMQEHHMVVDLDDGYQLSGIADLFDQRTGTVTDYKTCSVWKAQFGDYSDWRMQTLLYCWMLERLGHHARRGEVVAIMRDHSMRKARFDPEYPAHPVIVKRWDFTGDDLEEARNHVASWFSAVTMQELLGDGELEPCTDDEVWRKPDKWAVMRAGQRKAVRLLDSKGAAMEYMDWLSNQSSNKGRKLYIGFREGEDTKCKSYCPVAQWCPRGAKNFQES